MTFAEFERLVGHVAWPVVALIALPFLLSRIDKIYSMYKFFDSPKFADFISKIEDIHPKLESIGKHVEKVSSKIQEVQSNQEAEEASKILENEQVIQGLIDQDLISSDQVLLPSSSNSIEKSPDDMLVEMRSAWNAFFNSFDGKMRQAGIEYDGRKLGIAASKLTDKRRTNPLNSADALLIGELQSLFRRFTRLKSPLTDWLTPETYKNFIAGVKQAQERVDAALR